MTIRPFFALLLLMYASWHYSFCQISEGSWKKDVVLPRNQRITLWTENGWLKAARLNERNELLWALVIQKWKPTDNLRVDQEKTTVNIYGPDGALILANSSYDLWMPMVLRANHVPFVADSGALIDPSMFQVASLTERANSDEGQMLTLTDSTDWIYAAIGPRGSKRVQTIVRLMPRKLYQDNVAVAVGTEGFRAKTPPDYQLYDQDGFLFVEQMSDLVAKHKTGALEPLLEKQARPLSVQSWLNTPSPISLTSLRGSVVLLYFWAIWCQPCVAHLKDVQDLADRFQAEKFRLITIHTSESSNRLDDFLRQKPFLFPIGIGTDSTVQFYAQNQLPKYVLIDKHGIIKRVSSTAPTDDAIRAFLKDEHRSE
jgi:thiol-disulfide isomerase/thioredoxin